MQSVHQRFKRQSEKGDMRRRLISSRTARAARRWPLWLAAGLACLPLGAAQAESLVIERRVTIVHIPATPAPLPRPDFVPDPKQTSRNRCLPLDMVYGAMVESDRRVLLNLRGQRFFRLELGESCPALAYYEGFYFQPSRPGLICAGRDILIDRTGKSCAIRKIKPLKPRR